MKKALILDLDNTIYPVSSIANTLFEQFFEMLNKEADIDSSAINAAKLEMTRKPFQQVADEFNFSEALKKKGAELLGNLTYNIPMQPYADYKYIREISLDKFLVTAGFTNLQNSKINQLCISADFKEIYIVDPEVSTRTKKDIFQLILDKYQFRQQDLLIIGDDPQSEIKAGLILGIETFLYDPNHKYLNAETTYRGDNLKAVLAVI